MKWWKSLSTRSIWSLPFTLVYEERVYGSQGLFTFTATICYYEGWNESYSGVSATTCHRNRVEDMICAVSAVRKIWNNGAARLLVSFYESYENRPPWFIRTSIPGSNLFQHWMERSLFGANHASIVGCVFGSTRRLHHRYSQSAGSWSSVCGLIHFSMCWLCYAN